MNQLAPQMPVAIVGYGYRMPGEGGGGSIQTDDDFWRLLSERGIVQEPITDRYGWSYRPIGGFSSPGHFASQWEGLIRDDGEKLFDRGLFGPQSTGNRRERASFSTCPLGGRGIAVHLVPKRRPSHGRLTFPPLWT